MTTLRHIMVDVETLGVRPTSALLSIGAVEFNPHSDRLGGKFYYAIDPQECMDAGMTVDAGTILWWLKQSQEARDSISEGDYPRTFKGVLWKFSIFCYDYPRQFPQKDIRLWCQGPSFDAVILENAYRACGAKLPWAYNSPRDSRTIIEASGIDVTGIPFVGTPHHALHDAVHQAKVVQAAFKALNTAKAYQAVHGGCHVGWQEPETLKAGDEHYG